jgi:hypothetical protein
LLSNENLIRKKIRDRWLLGKDPDGNEIGIYSKSQIGAEYAFFKNKINPLAGVGNVDLTLTGALGKGIKVKLASNNIEIFSTDSKFDEIAEKYGDYNFNLSDAERDILFDKIGGIVLNKVINKTYALL